MKTTHAPESRYRLLDILELAKRNKMGLLCLASGGLVIASVFHFASPSFTAFGVLLMDSRAQQTSLQNLLGSLESSGGSYSARNVEEERLVMALRTSEFRRFYQKLVRQHSEYPLFREAIERPTDPKGNIYRWFNKIRGVRPDFTKEGPVPVANPTVRGEGVIDFRVNVSSPEAAIFLANCYFDAAVQFLNEQGGQKLQQAREYIGRKISETEASLGKTDERIVDKTRKNWALLSSQTVADALLKMDQGLQADESQRNQNLKVIESLKQKLSQMGGELGASLVGIRRTIADLEAENQLLEIRIDTIRKGMDRYMQNNISLPKDGQMLADLKRQKELNFFVFNNLAKALLDLEIKGLFISGSVHPLERVGPEHVTTTMGLLPRSIVSVLFGLLAGILWLALRQFLMPVIRMKGDIAKQGVSSLGMLPMANPRSVVSIGDSLKGCRFDFETPETASFRQVRARIIHLARNSGSDPRKTLGIFSWGHGEGKTFISYNLAACLAHTSARTVVVDLDLRRQSLSNNFRMNRVPGAIDVLESRCTLEKALKTDVAPYLDFLPAGELAPDSLERLTIHRFSGLIETLRKRYDYVVLDTAPLVVAHESLLLAQLCDFASLIVSAWKSRLDHIEEALDRIKEVRKAHIHFILNRAEDSTQSLAHGYYYYMGMHNRAKSIPELPINVPPSTTPLEQPRLDN